MKEELLEVMPPPHQMGSWLELPNIFTWFHYICSPFLYRFQSKRMENKHVAQISRYSMSRFYHVILARMRPEQSKCGKNIEKPNKMPQDGTNNTLDSTERCVLICFFAALVEASAGADAPSATSARHLLAAGRTADLAKVKHPPGVMFTSDGFNIQTIKKCINVSIIKKITIIMIL